MHYQKNKKVVRDVWIRILERASHSYPHLQGNKVRLMTNNDTFGKELIKISLSTTLLRTLGFFIIFFFKFCLTEKEILALS